MEGTPPAIGESSKVRTSLDLLRISKILALVIGILSFVGAAWNGIMLSWGWALYGVASGIINLLIYLRIDEFTNMISGRRYGELRDMLLIWAVLGIIFGVIVGILLIIVYIQVEVLHRTTGFVQQPVQQIPPPPPPPEQ